MAGRADCHCEPERRGGYPYNQFVGTYLGDCVYTPQDLASTSFGMLSILIWMFTQVPQLVENYRKQTVDSISAFFIIQWMLADALSLVAAIWTDQLSTEVYESIYFIAMDVIVLAQYSYYAYIRDRIWPPTEAELRYRRSQPPGMFGYPRMSMNALFAGSLFVAARYLPSLLRAHGTELAGAAAFPAGRALLGLAGPAGDDESALCDFHPQLTEEEYFVGHIASWGAALLYTTSRIPQIVKNYKSKTELTLAPVMVVMALAANLTFFVSIALRVPAYDEHFWRDIFPFLCASVGTFVGDVVIYCQLQMYRSGRRKTYAPLRSSDDDDDFTNF